MSPHTKSHYQVFFEPVLAKRYLFCPIVIILPGGQKVPRPLDNRLRSFHGSEFFYAPPSVGILELGVGRLNAERVGRFGSPKNGRKNLSENIDFGSKHLDSSFLKY